MTRTAQSLQSRFEESNLTLSSYNQYRTTYPTVEVIGGMLWDTVAFISAAVNRLTLFNAVRATPDLSNMETAGMLTNNKGFLIRAIRFNLLQGPVTTARAATGNVQPGGLDNLAQVLNTGFLRFTVGNKPYVEFPLWAVPGGEGVFSLMAVEGDTADPGIIVDLATNGPARANNGLILSQPLFLSPLVNFYAELQWPAAITFAPAANLNVRLTLDGDLMRPAQ